MPSVASKQDVAPLANKFGVCLARRQHYTAKLKSVHNRLTVSAISAVSFAIITAINHSEK
eukprot:15365598-Ditylum_brightwellii.AAC.1